MLHPTDRAEPGQTIVKFTVAAKIQAAGFYRISDDAASLRLFLQLAAEFAERGIGGTTRDAGRPRDKAEVYFFGKTMLYGWGSR